MDENEPPLEENVPEEQAMLEPSPSGQSPYVTAFLFLLLAGYIVLILAVLEGVKESLIGG